MTNTAESNNVDTREIAKFEVLAHRWWDRNGEFKPLHDINPCRLDFVDKIAGLAGKTIIDVGCGGGILAESMARRGGTVTGIDMGGAPLEVARLHALESGADVSYSQGTAEAFAAAHPGAFDVVTCMEMLEHVPDIHSTIRACAELTRPGGHLFFSTINRHPEAWVLLILGAEYVANILPKGTHDYARFIRPSELAAACRAADLSVRAIRGMRYNPLTRTTTLGDNTRANYLVHAIKE
ncbi:MAG: bifunctional 2-polyprenyl-6-hydroxyphenol methylase/3-demethylubiquinol 3-O-methyltransferase UbiG [Gammaproteobacteria bacterium]|nr:bifunctional 2-polyprenyl-6-hydroxyphenol methylase/3-demethylubiquinol 3-O-methyltransferase UbiG [Gammaproteobacteria bacterium]